MGESGRFYHHPYGRRYFIQYQNWRDNAIKKAEQLFEEKKDSVILSLDIKDYFHSVVKAALIQDGWAVTDDPLKIKVGGVDMEIDLGAEQIIAAERQGQKIAVEVKSFLVGTSAISEFHRALGQFINYRAALKSETPD